MRFFSLPGWALAAGATPPERLTPSAELPTELLAECLNRVEYRGVSSFERASALTRVSHAGPAVFARPPQDLPALLRTADQLLWVNRQEAGDATDVWLCTCGARFVLPSLASRPSAIRCDRCGRTVELDLSSAVHQPHFHAPPAPALVAGRVALSAFFREAMARGWWVLVEKA